MTVLQSKALVNLTDATVAEAIYSAVKGSEDSAMRGIAMGAVFFKVKGVNDASRAVLFLALHGKDGERMTVQSAKNAVSKCAAAADGAHFPWAVDVNRTIDDIVDDILPEFSAYWHATREIRKSGPDSETKKAEAKAKREASRAKSAAEQAEADAFVASLQERIARETCPEGVVSAFLALVSQLGENGPVLDYQTLCDVHNKVGAEIEARKADRIAQAA